MRRTESDLAWDFVSENSVTVERRLETLCVRVQTLEEKINALLEANVHLQATVDAMQKASCDMAAMLMRVESNQDQHHEQTDRKLDSLRVEGNQRLAAIKPALEELTKPSGPMRMQNLFWRISGRQDDEEDDAMA